MQIQQIADQEPVQVAEPLVMTRQLSGQYGHDLGAGLQGPLGNVPQRIRGTDARKLAVRAVGQKGGKRRDGRRADESEYVGEFLKVPVVMQACEAVENVEQRLDRRDGPQLAERAPGMHRSIDGGVFIFRVDVADLLAPPLGHGDQGRNVVGGQRVFGDVIGFAAGPVGIVVGVAAGSQAVDPLVQCQTGSAMIRLRSRKGAVKRDDT